MMLILLTQGLNSVVEVLNKYFEDDVGKDFMLSTYTHELTETQGHFIDYFISKYYKLRNIKIGTFTKTKVILTKEKSTH